MDSPTTPFWKNFGFFFNYLKQEKLYYQITLLALANLLLAIPILVITILIAALLFLASYKLAFEVLHTVSTGQLVYHDSKTYEIDDKIGFKAMAMAVVQILIYVFVYRRDPATGMALLIFTTIATPAYLMMLSKTQSVVASLNPFNLVTLIQRIGTEYLLLLVFFLLCAGLNLGFRYFMADLLPGVIGDVIAAWVLYFLLVFTFLVIGYVMYCHADELGHDTVDTETYETPDHNQPDPIRLRLEQLLQNDQAQEAINIIQQLQAEDGRTDLDVYLPQAEDALLKQQRLRPVDQVEQLINKQQIKQALELALSYLNDGHLIKPKQASSQSQLIRYAFDKNQFATVLKLCRDFDQRYPLEHQEIVDNYFLVAKIYYQNKKTDPAKKLLRSLLSKYQKTANTAAISSYLTGIDKLSRQT